MNRTGAQATNFVEPEQMEIIMRKFLIMVPVSAMAVLMAASPAAFAGGHGQAGITRANTVRLTADAGNNGGPVVRDHRDGSSQGGSPTGWGDGTVRDHRSGSASGWGDGANVRDHRKPIIEFRGLF
jgi:hypothetical protein